MRIIPLKKNAIFFVLFLTCIFYGSIHAHNISWNKAVVTVEKNRVTVDLHISQFDLLDTVAPGRWKEMYRNHDAWEELVPLIRQYVFDNIDLKVNGGALTRGTDARWRLEHAGTTEEVPADSNLGSIGISRYWPIDTLPDQVELTLNILKNINIPVKWVVLLRADNTDVKVYPHFVDRGEVACFDFREQAWMKTPGTDPGNGNTLWKTLVRFIQSVGKVFKH